MAEAKTFYSQFLQSWYQCLLDSTQLSFQKRRVAGIFLSLQLHQNQSSCLGLALPPLSPQAKQNVWLYSWMIVYKYGNQTKNCIFAWTRRLDMPTGADERGRWGDGERDDIPSIGTIKPLVSVKTIFFFSKWRHVSWWIYSCKWTTIETCQQFKYLAYGKCTSQKPNKTLISVIFRSTSEEKGMVWA